MKGLFMSIKKILDPKNGNFLLILERSTTPFNIIHTSKHYTSAINHTDYLASFNEMLIKKALKATQELGSKQNDSLTPQEEENSLQALWYSSNFILGVIYAILLSLVCFIQLG